MFKSLYSAPCLIYLLCEIFPYKSKALHVFNVDEVIEFQHEVMSKTHFSLAGGVVRK